MFGLQLTVKVGMYNYYFNTYFGLQLRLECIIIILILIRGGAPNFWPMSIVAKRLDGSK